MDFLPHLHAVSALQDRAADLIRDTDEAPVGITRYGRLVAALISPDDWATFQELKHAAERAFWTLDAERAARDVAAGDVEDWADVVSNLRGKLGGSAAKAGGGSPAKAGGGPAAKAGRTAVDPKGRSTKKSAARR
jgi:PHD/YefM family antitoxin component YafN of YafNO toxin-antitoxin module